MRRVVRITISLAVAAAWTLLSRALADEAASLAVLHSGAGRAAKEDACRQLKRQGTAAAVPALAELLGDAELATAARDALETLPGPEAGLALCAALDMSSGMLQAGLVDSLRRRRELAAVPRLVPLLDAPDQAVAAAAAMALGSLATPGAVAALQAALARGPAGRRDDCVDALLRSGEGQLVDGRREAAVALYAGLLAAGLDQPARTAAWIGTLLAAEDAAQQVTLALRNADPAAQQAVVARSGDLAGAEVTRALASALPELAPWWRARLLETLARRNDPAAAAAVAACAEDPEPAVRLAALAALADLGDGAHVRLLAERASRASAAERLAAREALQRLHRGDVDRQLLGLLAAAPVPLQEEVMAALASRGSRAACAELLTLAGAADETAALAALQALAKLADAGDAGALAALTVRTGNPAVRDACGRALVAVAQRTARRDEVAAAILAVLPESPVPARCTLLRAAGETGAPAVVAALRAALGDAAPEVQEAALRALAEKAGPEVAPDLLRLGRDAATPTLRVVAWRGYWRVVGLAADRPSAARLQLCRDGLAACERPEEKRLGLAELAKVPEPAALEMANQTCADAALRAEAELAAVQLAVALLGQAREPAEATLRRLVGGAADERTRAQAQAALSELQRAALYVMPWLAAGPYRQDGKECSQLFDIAFAPEQPGAAVAWQPAVAPADPALFWQVDLASVVAGNHAVAYLRTRAFSPREQAVALALGVDDGVKLWVNGDLVHANNAVRGLVPDQDKAQATLRQGWNELLAKVTQHTAGCGICVRLALPDGSVVDGLRIDPEGKD